MKLDTKHQVLLALYIEYQKDLPKMSTEVLKKYGI